MSPGQHVLAVVKAVNDFDLALSLPNHLTGFVACDKVSTALAATFSAYKEGTAAAAAAEIPSLKTYYAPGELVVAVITSVESPKTGGRRRRIELSLLPAAVNAGYSIEALVEGAILPGEVVAHEDRGYIIDLGMGAGSERCTGFLADVNAPAPLPVGKVAPFLVSSTFDARKRRVVTLSHDGAVLAGTRLGGRPEIGNVCCGSLVEATVKEVKEASVAVSFCGHAGRIDVMNMAAAGRLAVGQRVVGRVAFADYNEKRIHLSALPRITAWAAPIEDGRVGDRVANAAVLRIDAGLGALLDVGEADHRAYVHISRLSDDHVERIEGGTYKVGSTHTARIIDYDAFSGTYQASLQRSIVSEKILSLKDLLPGQVVKGTVSKIESFGALVAITERIRGVCPTAQMTQVQSATAAAKALTVGQRYNFRVLDCDPATRRITLTRKRALLDSTLPVLSSFEQAKEGNTHDGYIVAIQSFGAIVRFFGDVKGILLIAEMSDTFADRPQDALFVGQVVRCRIMRCDAKAERLSLTLRQQSGPKAKRAKPAAVLDAVLDAAGEEAPAVLA